MLVVIPVVAMLIGLALLAGADLILTMALVALSALPGLEPAELFSREMPRTGELLVGTKLHSGLGGKFQFILLC